MGERLRASVLGERIRAARMAHGISQAELARRIGITSNAMNMIEQGDTPDPRVSRIVAIAKYLGITYEDLLGSLEDDETGFEPVVAALA